MEPTATSAAAHTRQVIELAIEETVVYDLTWKIRIKYPSKHSIPTRVTPQLLGQKKTAVAKERPVAKVLPAIRERKRSDATEKDCKGDTIEKLLKPLVIAEPAPEPVSVYVFTIEKGNDALPNNNIKEEIAQVQVEDTVLEGSKLPLGEAVGQENLENNNREGNISKETVQGDVVLDEKKVSVEKEQENPNWEGKNLQGTTQELEEQENQEIPKQEENFLEETALVDNIVLDENILTVQKEQENQENSNWEGKDCQETAEVTEERKNQEDSKQEEAFLKETPQVNDIVLDENKLSAGEEQGSENWEEKFLQETAKVTEERKIQDVSKQEEGFLKETPEVDVTVLEEKKFSAGEEQENLSQEGKFLQETTQVTGEEQEKQDVAKQEEAFLKETLELDDTFLEENKSSACEEQENKETPNCEEKVLQETTQVTGEEQENQDVAKQEEEFLKETPEVDDIVLDEKKLSASEEQENRRQEGKVLCKSSLKYEDQVQGRPDPCGCHRDWVREEVLFTTKNKAFGVKTSCNMECVDGQGCHMEGTDMGENHQKETTITDCLEEFLKGLHLTHLLDYLKVLGCMCVRDLRLLEMPELEAIQLISRRRLLKQLDSLSLHHEAPPEECSLEAWLTWYGLTHISGFLTAIGVHSVGDLQYLSEDDLLLLKPVTRRRILACHKK